MIPVPLRRGWRRGAAVSFALLLLGAAAPLRAAKFGVPGATDPPGYFVLVGWDTTGTGTSNGFGDLTRDVVIYIEVTGTSLKVDLYNPGLHSTAGNMPAKQLDLNLSPTHISSQMAYTLYGPNGFAIKQSFYGADTPATDHKTVNFYDNTKDLPKGPILPGLYRLEAVLVDAFDVDEDVSVFGVSIPNYDAWMWYATAGEVKAGGATITEPLKLYPYVSSAQAAVDNSINEPVCGLSFVNYDLDALASGVAPPTMSLTTRRGFTFDPAKLPLNPSADADFYITRNKGIPYGTLDTNDMGIWTWTFSDLALVTEPTGAGYDLNVFMAQVLNFDIVARYFENFPVRPPDMGDAPRRIYLPRDNGTAPQKENLGQAAVIVAGPNPLTVGGTSTVEVTLTLDDPNAYNLTNLAGDSFVNPDAQFSNPVMLSASPGLIVTPDPTDAKHFRIGGTVGGGTTGFVKYRVDVTPTSSALNWVTGDGQTWLGGSRATSVSYDTVYATGEVLGPVCMLPFSGRVANCTPKAAITASTTAVCAGGQVDLGGGGSTISDCTGVVEYQWRAGGNIVAPFPAASTLTVNPLVDTSYTLDVRCSKNPACADFAQVLVQILPPPSLTITPANPSFCIGDSVDLQATKGLAPYLWTTTPPGLPGDGSTADSLLGVSAAGSYAVSATGANGCTGAATVVVMQSQDNVPGPLGNTLLLTKESVVDARANWQDLAVPAATYQVLRLDCDANLDGICDTPALDANFAPLTPIGSVAPGVQTLLDAAAVARPSFLVYYRVRATSPCSQTPGSP